jgi:hypothetical protein
LKLTADSMLDVRPITVAVSSCPQITMSVVKATSTLVVATMSYPPPVVTVTLQKKAWW